MIWMIPMVPVRFCTRNFPIHFSRNYSTGTWDNFLSEHGRSLIKQKLSTCYTQDNKANLPIDSAILMPLVNMNGIPSLMFTIRSFKLRSHSGQVSFPGGRKDNSDSNEIATALREAEEEIGICRSKVEVLGTCQPVIGRQLKSRSSPVVGFLDEFNPSDLKLNPDEVSKVFLCSLEELCLDKNNRFTVFRFKGGEYCYTLPLFISGQYKIWGMSAIMVHQLLTAIVPGYKSSIKFNYFDAIKH